MELNQEKYVYVCGYYSSDNQTKQHIIGIFLEEKDAINKMINESNSKKHKWLFIDDCEPFDNINTYTDFNDFMKKNGTYSVGHHEFMYYLYIEKVKLD